MDLVLDLKSTVQQNQAFRNVLQTCKHSQLVAMTLKPGEDIGEEIHPGNDQFIYILEGYGEAVLWEMGNDQVYERTYDLSPGISVSIPAGTKHNILNNFTVPKNRSPETSSIGKMKLFTIYSPPLHPDQEYQLIKPNE